MQDPAAAHHGTTGAIDPVCGMKVDPHTAKHRARTWGPHRIISARPAAAPNSSPIRTSICRPTKQAAEPGAGRHDLHLPDASGDPAGRSGLVPDLRHGARARAGDRRDRAQSRTRRHDAAVLDRPRADPAGLRARDGSPSGRRARISSRSDSRTGSSSRSRPRWCCGRDGRSSCAAGSRCVTRNLNMFTLIALGHRRGLALQRRRDASRPSSFPPPSADMTASVAVYFEAAAVITVLVLLARCWSCARARRPRARSGRCSISRPRPRGASMPMAATRRSRSMQIAGRRPPARPARREDAGRRRGRWRAAPSIDKSHGDRRIDAGDQGARRAR